MIEPQLFYSQLKQILCDEGKEEGLHFVYRQTNYWLRNQKLDYFEQLFDLLLKESPSWLLENYIIGLSFLTTTYLVKNQIKNRCYYFSFYQKLLLLKFNKEEVNRILYNLETNDEERKKDGHK